MSDAKPSLILYGVPFSQPVRAVLWLLFIKRMPFEMVLINPGSKGENGSRHPSYLAKNPAGTIPMIEDRETGFVLAEAHAILAYLCNRHGWTDLYPEDAEAVPGSTGTSTTTTGTCATPRSASLHRRSARTWRSRRPCRTRPARP